MKHNLDQYPIPREQTPLFINEPWLVDRSLDGLQEKEPESEPDNVRIYVPVDLNRSAIVRRIAEIIYRYEPATEANEFEFSHEIESVLSQVEIYDQVWLARHGITAEMHSVEATVLMAEIIEMLKRIEDGCAELFPFEMVDELEMEYFNRKSEYYNHGLE